LAAAALLKAKNERNIGHNAQTQNQGRLVDPKMGPAFDFETAGVHPLRPKNGPAGTRRKEVRGQCYLLVF
jgi:hypothetical protein